jgi:hypothetical protein
MNFSVQNGFGFVGSLILFGALTIAFIIVVTLVIRLVRGPDDTPAPPPQRATDEDDLL